MKSIKTIIGRAVIALVAVWVLWLGFKWGVMRVYVPPDQALLVMNKFGAPLPPDLVVVPANETSRYQGVQEEVLGPGRYFIDPIRYHTEPVPLLEIPAGDPHRWEWDSAGALKDPSTAPMVGLVMMKQGRIAPAAEEVVPAGYKGIQIDVLTPGVYKINPQLEEVKLVPATIVPPGSVGVVTQLVGDTSGISIASASLTRAPSTNPATQPADELGRLVVGATHRGILRDVLQPGIYYINPRTTRITIVPVGYDEVTLDHHAGNAVRFYSKDGYRVEADFTVVWGRSPADAPEIVANIGDTKRVEQNVIAPAMESGCQLEGAKYTAVELIQGVTRSRFQDDLSKSLEAQVAPRHISVLLALVRNITIKDRSGADATEGLLATMQRANIEVERNLTNQQKTETASKSAELEQASRLIDVAKENVRGETTVKVANIVADAAKKAAEIDAQRDLAVATVNLEAAQLEAKRTEILGKAKADVEQMKNDAEAKGAKLMVDAFGSPQAYNQYIFAKNFDPAELKLIFAGPGTFWTDLKSFQEVGAAKTLRSNGQSDSAGKK